MTLKTKINSRLLLPISAVFLLSSSFLSATADSSLASPAVDISTDMTAMKVQDIKGQSKHADQMDAVYVCPMHPEETSHKSGSCSKCGMFLVARSMNDNDDITHDHQASSTGDIHTDTSATADIQHSEIPMNQHSKPALYWENEQSQADNHEQHNHAKPAPSDQSVSKRMQPDLPTISGTADMSMPDTPEEHAKKHQNPNYTCPMHPQIIQHEPGGNCPICGMDLVLKRVSSATTSSETPQVFLSAAVIQNMGVRTAKVQKKTMNKRVRTQGMVTADDERLLSIHPRTGGWIEVLHLITEGDRIERKDVLVDFYSPWINQVQLEFITALEEYDLTSFDPSRKTELAAKVESLRNSLRLLNVMDMDIMRIKNSRKVQNTIQLMAPQGGIVTSLNINEGSYVEPYQSMFTIVDLSQVWIMVDIYEHQAPWVRKGYKVEVSAPAIPARSWQGVVDFIYPRVDPKTRTLRARIVLPNPDEALLLNMFVKVDITSNTNKQAVLTVPREAVIITGERKSVIKALGKGHFQPVEVTTGNRSGGSVEILSGLQQGEEIVVSGQFLIDSESSLQASFLRLSEE